MKTRSLAAKLVIDGHVRVNGVRVETAAKAVKPGDVLTVALERQVRVLRIRDAGERRGPAPEAQKLYDDLTAGRIPSGARPDEPAGSDR